MLRNRKCTQHTLGAAARLSRQVKEPAAIGIADRVCRRAEQRGMAFEQATQIRGRPPERILTRLKAFSPARGIVVQPSALISGALSMAAAA